MVFTQGSSRRAAAEVINTVELLENIILFLPISEILLNANRISRYWNGVIKGSPRLQQSLFFKPLSKGPVQLYGYQKLDPGWTYHQGGGKFWNKNRTIRSSFCSQTASGPLIATFLNLFLELLGELDAPTDTFEWYNYSKAHEAKEKHSLLDADMRPEASWRKMLILQPAVEEVQLHSVEPQRHGDPEKWVRNRTGISIADIYSSTMGRRIEFCPARHDVHKCLLPIKRIRPTENAWVEVWGSVLKCKSVAYRCSDSSCTANDDGYGCCRDCFVLLQAYYDGLMRNNAPMI